MPPSPFTSSRSRISRPRTLPAHFRYHHLTCQCQALRNALRTPIQCAECWRPEVSTTESEHSRATCCKALPLTPPPPLSLSPSPPPTHSAARSAVRLLALVAALSCASRAQAELTIAPYAQVVGATLTETRALKATGDTWLCWTTTTLGNALPLTAATGCKNFVNTVVETVLTAENSASPRVACGAKGALSIAWGGVAAAWNDTLHVEVKSIECTSQNLAVVRTPTTVSELTLTLTPHNITSAVSEKDGTPIMAASVGGTLTVNTPLVSAASWYCYDTSTTAVAVTCAAADTTSGNAVPLLGVSPGTTTCAKPNVKTAIWYVPTQIYVAVIECQLDALGTLRAIGASASFGPITAVRATQSTAVGGTLTVLTALAPSSWLCWRTGTLASPPALDNTDCSVIAGEAVAVTAASAGVDGDRVCGPVGRQTIAWGAGATGSIDSLQVVIKAVECSSNSAVQAASITTVLPTRELSAHSFASTALRVGGKLHVAGALAQPANWLCFNTGTSPVLATCAAASTFPNAAVPAVGATPGIPTCGSAGVVSAIWSVAAQLHIAAIECEAAGRPVGSSISTGRVDSAATPVGGIVERASLLADSRNWLCWRGHLASHSPSLTVASCGRVPGTSTVLTAESYGPGGFAPQCGPAGSRSIGWGDPAHAMRDAAQVELRTVECTGERAAEVRSHLLGGWLRVETALTGSNWLCWRSGTAANPPVLSAANCLASAGVDGDDSQPSVVLTVANSGSGGAVLCGLHGEQHAVWGASADDALHVEVKAVECSGAGTGLATTNFAGVAAIKMGDTVELVAAQGRANRPLNWICWRAGVAGSPPTTPSCPASAGVVSVLTAVNSGPSAAGPACGPAGTTTITWGHASTSAADALLVEIKAIECSGPGTGLEVTKLRRLVVSPHAIEGTAMGVGGMVRNALSVGGTLTTEGALASPAHWFCYTTGAAPAAASCSDAGGDVAVLGNAPGVPICAQPNVYTATWAVKTQKYVAVIECATSSAPIGASSGVVLLDTDPALGYPAQSVRIGGPVTVTPPALLGGSSWLCWRTGIEGSSPSLTNSDCPASAGSATVLTAASSGASGAAVCGPAGYLSIAWGTGATASADALQVEVNVIVCSGLGNGLAATTTPSTIALTAHSLRGSTLAAGSILRVATPLAQVENWFCYTTGVAPVAASCAAEGGSVPALGYSPGAATCGNAGVTMATWHVAEQIHIAVIECQDASGPVGVSASSSVAVAVSAAADVLVEGTTPASIMFVVQLATQLTTTTGYAGGPDFVTIVSDKAVWVAGKRPNCALPIALNASAVASDNTTLVLTLLEGPWPTIQTTIVCTAGNGAIAPNPAMGAVQFTLQSTQDVTRAAFAVSYTTLTSIVTSTPTAGPTAHPSALGASIASVRAMLIIGGISAADFELATSAVRSEFKSSVRAAAQAGSGGEVTVVIDRVVDADPWERRRRLQQIYIEDLKIKVTVTVRAPGYTGGAEQMAVSLAVFFADTTAAGLKMQLGGDYPVKIFQQPYALRPPAEVIHDDSILGMPPWLAISFFVVGGVLLGLGTLGAGGTAITLIVVVLVKKRARDNEEAEEAWRVANGISSMPSSSPSAALTTSTTKNKKKKKKKKKGEEDEVEEEGIQMSENPLKKASGAKPSGAASTDFSSSTNPLRRQRVRGRLARRSSFRLGCIRTNPPPPSTRPSLPPSSQSKRDKKKTSASKDA